MPETRFAAALRAVGGIRGVRECLNKNNTAPLLILIEEAWRQGAETMRDQIVNAAGTVTMPPVPRVPYEDLSEETGSAARPPAT